jgi:hypothetical protein
VPKLPACLRRVKAAAAPCAASALPALALLGCGTIVAPSATPGRPDTVATADLLGPYEGQVLEAETGRPIAGAMVIGSFGFSRGVGLRAPAGAAVVTARTDADGRYRIVAPEPLPTGPSLRLDRFTLIVYRKGSTAYRSDRMLLSDRIEARRDFTQRGNVVRLGKLDTGHARHLEFLGVWGGPASLARALRWEFDEAARETRADGAGGARNAP